MKTCSVIIMLLISIIVSNSQTFKLKNSNSGFMLMIGFGASIPLSKSQFVDTFYTGINYRIAVGYIFGKHLGFRANFQLNRYKRLSSIDVRFSEIGTNGVLWITSGGIEIISGTFKRCECLQPYGFMGADFYHVDISKNIDGKEFNGSETNFGGNIGVGLSYRLFKQFRIGLETQLNLMANDGTIKSFIPINLNLIYINN